MIYIKQLTIQNFKSIENETIEFKKGLNVLVGPNNAGKTNIMEAIEFLLGDVYLPNFEPTTDHFFYGKEDREIIIEATLEGDGLSEIDREFNSSIDIRFRYSKQNGGSFEVKINDQWKQKYNKSFGYYWDFEKKIFFLRVKSLRNIMEIAPIRWKSPLKYFKELIIKKSGSQLGNILSKIDEVKEEFCKIDFVRKIISDLLKISKGQTDIKNIEISPASTKKSDILNEMKILIDDGYLSEVTKKGLGTQNLIIISLFRIMAEYMRDEEKKFIIYGIDEPEIGLHPHGQRQLINSLKELSEVSQVIITTHSEHLIDLTQIDNVIRIVKENNATKQYKINLTADEKKILEIHGRNLEEIFFAKQVLIVEGDTEEGFFPEASKKVIEKKENEEIEENYSFDYNSVSVINGKGNNIWFFIRLLKSLNIPFVVLIDEDKLNDKNSFLKKIEENNLIEKEEIKKLKDINNKEELKSVLKKYNIFILLPFEKIISENSKKETLRKIVKAINFVKEQWGNEIESNYFETDNVKKEDVFELLKRNKGWRIGKAVAQELNYDELPKDYVEIIKRVSKLWLGQ